MLNDLNVHFNNYTLQTVTKILFYVSGTSTVSYYCNSKCTTSSSCFSQSISEVKIVFLACFGYVRADLHDTILSHVTSSRQAYEMTYDCRSILKDVLKCYDIFSDVHNNRKSCRGPVVSRCRVWQNRTL